MVIMTHLDYVTCHGGQLVIMTHLEYVGRGHHDSQEERGDNKEHVPQDGHEPTATRGGRH